MADHGINEMAQAIRAWADQALPNRTPAAAFLKLYKEIAELIDEPTDRLEYADVCIMVFDLAVLNGVDLAQAIYDKLEINKARRWEASGLGVYQHTRTEGDDEGSRTEVHGVREDGQNP